MTKEEMKNKISMELKNPVTQQGFEIICKHILELQKDKGELTDKIADLEKNVEQAKSIIKEMLPFMPKENIEGIYEIVTQSEDFIKE